MRRRRLGVMQTGYHMLCIVRMLHMRGLRADMVALKGRVVPAVDVLRWPAVFRRPLGHQRRVGLP